MRRRVYRIRRTYEPAYHRPRRARRRLRIPASVRLYGVAVLLAAGLWWVSQLPQLQLRTVEVAGDRKASRGAIVALINAQLDATRFGILPQRQFLWFDAAAAARQLRQQLGLASVEVTRRWPGTVLVTIHEPAAALVWVSGSQGYYVNDQGQVTAPVSADDALQLEQGSVRVFRHPAVAQPVPVVYDLANQPPVSGHPVVPPATLAFLLAVNARLADRAVVAISHYQVDAVERRVVAVTEGGWQIIFSSDRGVGEQLASLQTVLARSIKDRSQLKYIDVRYGGKVYYR